MNRKDFWWGVMLLLAGILVHAALPRYDYRPTDNKAMFMRIDRWTGDAQLGVMAEGPWITMAEWRQKQHAEAYKAAQ